LLKDERGNAVIEFPVAVLFLLLLVLGTFQIAFSLYARNVVAASAHEGARAYAEIGRNADGAEAVVTRVVRRAVGGIVDGLAVRLRIDEASGTRSAVVEVTGSVKPWGVVPVGIPLQARAVVTNEALRP
jgi:hypothetical protein